VTQETQDRVGTKGKTGHRIGQEAKGAEQADDHPGFWAFQLFKGVLEVSDQPLHCMSRDSGLC